MSENTLIEKIKQDAAGAVAEIKAAGAAEVEGIQRETDAAVAALKEAQAIALKKQKEQMELVSVSRAKQAGNIAVQQAKRNQIDAIFAEVKKELMEQSADEYVSFFQKFAVEIIPKGVDIKTVIAPAQRQGETKQILEKLGLSGEVVSDPNIKAGFIAHAKDGVYDVTLDRLLNEKRSALEMVIVKKVMA